MSTTSSWTVRQLADLVVEEAAKDLPAARILFHDVPVRWAGGSEYAGVFWRWFQWCSSTNGLCVDMRGCDSGHLPRLDDWERSLREAGYTVERGPEVVRVHVPPRSVSDEVRGSTIEATLEYFEDRRRFLEENVSALVEQRAADSRDACQIRQEAMAKLAEIEVEHLRRLSDL